MNIDLLIKMTNEISANLGTNPDREAAVRDVASHLRRFWEPRMRAQIIQYWQERQGGGLSDLSLEAVALLAQTSQPAKS